MKRFLILLLIFGCFTVVNASFYVEVASIHKIEGEPCYMLELQIYDNNGTSEPMDDVILDTVWARVCPEHKQMEDSIQPSAIVRRVFNPNNDEIMGYEVKSVDIQVFPAPISNSEKLNVNFNGKKFNYLSISPVNEIQYSQDNFIILNNEIYSGKMSIDISKLKSGVYVLNAVSVENRIVSSVEFIVK